MIASEEPEEQARINRETFHAVINELRMQALEETRERRLEKALNAMLTYFGMDEDEWTKPIFDEARRALEKP